MCRDKSTFNILQNKNVNVVLFGCITQLLNINNIPDIRIIKKNMKIV